MRHLAVREREGTSTLNAVSACDSALVIFEAAKRSPYGFKQRRRTTRCIERGKLRQRRHVYSSPGRCAVTCYLPAKRPNLDCGAGRESSEDSEMTARGVLYSLSQRRMQRLMP